MSEWQLEASGRVPRGKGGARQLRREGLVPGIVYGVTDPVAVQVPERAALKLVQRLQGASHVVTLKLPQSEGGERRVLVKEVQTTAVGGKLVHIDFNEVVADTKVRVNVEVRPVGSAAGTILGGTQQIIMHEIPIECLPEHLPEVIEADVTTLKIGDALHIGEITFPQGIRVLADSDAAVIVISGRMKDEAEEAEAVEGLEVETTEATAGSPE